MTMDAANRDRSTPQDIACGRPTSGSGVVSRRFLIVALFLVGMNLRPALSSVAPVLDAIRAGTGLSLAEAGALTTLPVFCFGLFSFVAPQLTRWMSAERAIFYSLLALLFAIGMRAFFGVPALFIGTFIAGASIGIVMALLPSVLQRDFPDKAGHITGVYTMAMNAGSALAAGAAVPLEQIPGGGWRLALGFWMLPAVIAGGAWWIKLRRNPAVEKSGNTVRREAVGLVGNALAWQVTAYLGLQSALAYCVFGWFPTMMADRGMSPLTAGFMLSISIAAQWITSLTGPWMATRGKDQRTAIVALLCLTVVGFLGCLYAPHGTVWLWAILLGLGQGGTFSVAMALIVLRSPNAHVAASLSGMAQGVGYIIAAIAPLATGVLHDRTGDWDAVAVAFVIVAIGTLAAAMGAGRNVLIREKPQRR
jgi:CP family cyanate transporter-like MFS transporter